MHLFPLVTALLSSNNCSLIPLKTPTQGMVIYNIYLNIIWVNTRVSIGFWENKSVIDCRHDMLRAHHFHCCNMHWNSTHTVHRDPSLLVLNSVYVWSWWEVVLLPCRVSVWLDSWHHFSWRRQNYDFNVESPKRSHCVSQSSGDCIFSKYVGESTL